MQGLLPPATTPAASNWSSTVYTLVGIVVVGALVYGVYWYAFQKGSGAWKPIVDKLTTIGATFDGKAMNVISGAEIPPGVQDYGMQFWMYIKDWDYRYGQEKVVLRRVDPTVKGAVGPEISLAPNENTLQVRVSLFPAGGEAQASTPAPANQGGSATGDSFTCKVENVPLQSWFSVTVTVFQRNLDIYLNGKLVKSCVLPGVPRPVAGDVEVGPDGGFSGTVCDVYSYAKALVPTDALAFYTQGTPCASQQQEKGDLTGNLFGYTAKFGLFDKQGKVVKEYVY